MKNIFDKTNDVNNNINRNFFDWSHDANLSGEFGVLYPFFSELVPQNSTLEITSMPEFHFMPMTFPVQTPIQARVSYFKIPLRTLWRDYKDFIGNFRDDLEEPYIDLANSFPYMTKIGGIMDHMDIPVVLYGNGSFAGSSYVPSRNVASNVILGDYSNVAESIESLPDVFAPYIMYRLSSPDIQNSLSGSLDGSDKFSAIPITSSNQLGQGTDCSGITFGLRWSNLTLQEGKVNLSQFSLSGQTVTFYFLTDIIQKSEIDSLEASGLTGNLYFSSAINASGVTQDLDSPKFSHLAHCPVSLRFLDSVPFVSEDIIENRNVVAFDVYIPDLGDFSNLTCTIPHSVMKANQFFIDISFSNQLSLSQNIYASYVGTGIPEVTGTFLREGDSTQGYKVLMRETSPYYDSTSTKKYEQLKISAYKFRAYESVYNSYYRDMRNNPYFLNGRYEYNTWIPNDKGGADKYVYQLHNVNWDKDFLTTAVQSPQQGRAPLVGLTTYTDMSEDTKTVKLSLTDESGKSYSLNINANSEGITSAEFAPLPVEASVEPLNYHKLVSLAQTGISIPDLRIVNAYQKFLELNMRKSYSYKEIIEGRFDCQVKYDDLMIPEFLGGYTRQISVNRVIQSVDVGAINSNDSGNYSDQLGSLAGDAFLSSGDTPKISVYCDEECIVLGVVSIVPRANYSQLLPKDFLYRNLLDHFQPEFNNLGFQPISYAEVCPVQVFNSDLKFTDTFGYNRPYYEYVQKYDKVHGLYRTELRDFLVNRTFDSPPLLSRKFLQVFPDQLNDVFSVTETTDKFFGVIHLSIDASLPISSVAIPRLD